MVTYPFQYCIMIYLLKKNLLLKIEKAYFFMIFKTSCILIALAVRGTEIKYMHIVMYKSSERSKQNFYFLHTKNRICNDKTCTIIIFLKIIKLLTILMYGIKQDKDSFFLYYEKVD